MLLFWTFSGHLLQWSNCLQFKIWIHWREIGWTKHNRNICIPFFDSSVNSLTRFILDWYGRSAIQWWSFSLQINIVRLVVKFLTWKHKLLDWLDFVKKKVVYGSFCILWIAIVSDTLNFQHKKSISIIQKWLSIMWTTFINKIFVMDNFEFMSM